MTTSKALARVITAFSADPVEGVREWLVQVRLQTNSASMTDPLEHYYLLPIDQAKEIGCRLVARAKEAQEKGPIH